MKRIVVSCAPAGTGRGSNLGMNTVDYAMHNIVQQSGLSDKVELYRPWPSYVPDKNGNFPEYFPRDIFPMKFNYSYAQVGGENKKDALIYWGDFQHGKDYHLQSSKRLESILSMQGIKETAENCLDLTRKYFLLQDNFEEKSLPFKIGIYGGTLFQNNIKDYLHKSYIENLKWLYNSAAFVKVRDVYSANMVNYLRDNYENNYLGVDAALLNKKEELLALPKLSPQEFESYQGAIGIYFGRSTKSFPTQSTVRFINELSMKMNTNIVNIPWGYFSSGLFSFSMGRFSEFLIRNYRTFKNVEFTPGDILEGMSQLQLIITDTYHVVINAIVLGIPAICIYEPSPLDLRNANMGYAQSWRDKRALFYLANNLSDYLVASTSITDKKYRALKVDHILSILQEQNHNIAAYQNLLKTAQLHREKIGSFLNSI